MKVIIDAFIWFFAVLFLFASQVTHMLGHLLTSVVCTGIAVIFFAAALFVTIQEYRRGKNQKGK